LDGKRLGTDHFSGPQPALDRKVSLEVRAAGRVTERKEIVLTRDMSLQIVLAPDPALPAASAPVVPAPEPSTPTSRPRPATRVTSKLANASGTRARKCNPPYVFAADGVKTYKPECF
jgi:hypothetical protein